MHAFGRLLVRGNRCKREVARLFLGLPDGLAQAGMHATPVFLPDRRVDRSAVERVGETNSLVVGVRDTRVLRLFERRPDVAVDLGQQTTRGRRGCDNGQQDLACLGSQPFDAPEDELGEVPGKWKRSPRRHVRRQRDPCDLECVERVSRGGLVEPRQHGPGGR
jgi:hypothetical protein